MANKELSTASPDSSNNSVGAHWSWDVNGGYTLKPNISTPPVPVPEAQPTQTEQTEPVVIFPTPLYTNLH